MEPERKIEKLLRAYAKKRRADAGDPLTLHPATRRLLQGEVARRKPKPDDEEEASLTLWELFRQRWALFAGFAVIIFFGAALFLPALSKAKYKAQSVTAENNLKQIGAAVQVAAEANDGRLPASLVALKEEVGSERILTDPETGKPFVYVAGGKKLDALSSNDVLAYSPSEKTSNAVLFADGRVEVVNGARLAKLTGGSSSQLLAANESFSRQQFEETALRKDAGNAAAPPLAGQAGTEADQRELKLADQPSHTVSGGMLAANSPTPAPPTLDQQAKVPGAAADEAKSRASTFQFATVAGQGIANTAQNSFKNTTVPAQSTAVLANFQVQQNGRAIRVVDADGSVYDGALQPEVAATAGEPTPSVAPSASIVTAPAQRDKEKSFIVRDELQASQNYFFRVTGTNLTLKQNVVFAGSLLANFNAATNEQQAINRNGSFGGGQLPLALTNQLPWSNSRIAGTAVVSDTNSIEINAVPQAP